MGSTQVSGGPAVVPRPLSISELGSGHPQRLWDVSAKQPQVSFIFFLKVNFY